MQAHGKGWILQACKEEKAKDYYLGRDGRVEECHACWMGGYPWQATWMLDDGQHAWHGTCTGESCLSQTLNKPHEWPGWLNAEDADSGAASLPGGDWPHGKEQEMEREYGSALPA